MYINPTLQFLVGLLYFHEALDVNQFLAFCIIWVGLAVTMAGRIPACARRSGPCRPPSGRSKPYSRTGTAWARVRGPGLRCRRGPAPGPHLEPPRGLAKGGVGSVVGGRRSLPGPSG